eukprot:2713152-Pyramimonas_sp.AAC.1
MPVLCSPPASCDTGRGAKARHRGAQLGGDTTSGGFTRVTGVAAHRHGVWSISDREDPSSIGIRFAIWLATRPEFFLLAQRPELIPAYGTFRGPRGRVRSSESWGDAPLHPIGRRTCRGAVRL